MKIAPWRSAPQDGQVSSSAGETVLQRLQMTESSDSEYSGRFMSYPSSSYGSTHRASGSRHRDGPKQPEMRALRERASP
ncbi:protein of unknown function [Caballeronia sp. S22]